MKFLIDMPLSPALAAWLVEQGHDAVHVSAIGLAKATDAQIIAVAKHDTRTIITADLDYPRLLAALKARDPSLILLRDGEWSEADVMDRITGVLRAMTDDQIRGSVIVVEKLRIRRRNLPL